MLDLNLTTDTLSTLSASAAHSAPTPTRRMSSSHRVTRVYPALKALHQADNLTVTTSRKNVRSVAVSFGKSSLLSSQRQPTLSSTVVDASSPLAISLRLNELNPSEPDPCCSRLAAQAVWNSLFFYFAGFGAPGSKAATIDLPLPSPILHDALLALGSRHSDNEYSTTRSALFQQFHFATTSLITPPFPYVPVTLPATETLPVERVHPLRPAKPLGSTTAAKQNPIYSRIIPSLESHFRLDPVTMADLPTLHNWLNDERVDVFWREKGTIEDHRNFVQTRLDDAHVIPVIGSYVSLATEGEATTEHQAVYSEIYWAKEDRLGPLYSSLDYDRGIHVLVGSNAHRGPHRVRAWLPSLVHHCFLDDARTLRVVAEPNELNEKMIKYFESVGFVRHGSVQFPHKVAALMICERNHFYDLCPL